MNPRLLMFVPVLVLAAGPCATALTGPVISADSPQRIDVVAQDCPVGEMLRRLCESLRCDLWLDPAVDGRVTLTLVDRDIAFVLGQALGRAAYVITWEKAGARERIRSIAVFREGLRDRLDRVAAGPAAPPAAAREAPPEPNLDRASAGRLFRRLETLYAETRLPGQREAVVDFVAAITSRDFEPDLVRVVEAAGETPTALERAAIRALSNMGTAVSVNGLLDRIEAGGRVERGLGEGLRNVVGTPASLAALRAAAAGSKRYAAPRTRVEAVRSLARFKDPQTVRLLKGLAADPVESVRLAAAAALDPAGGGGEDGDE